MAYTNAQLALKLAVERHPNPQVPTTTLLREAEKYLVWLEAAR